MMRVRSFYFYLLISLMIHLLVGLLMTYDFSVDNFWGGGMKANDRIQIQLSVIDVHVIDGKTGVQIKKTSPVFSQPMTKGNGFGFSSTPEGGVGSGVDSSSAISEPDTLKKIRQKIMRARHYPLQALEQGIEGTVKLAFTIDQKGGVNNISVLTSSGSSLLDEEGISTVKRATPFPLYPERISIALRFDLDDEF